MDEIVVLAGIVQILLFFIFWRILYTLTRKSRTQLLGKSIVSDLLVNLAIALVLLISAHTIDSVWWLMSIIGAAVGVLTGQMAARNEE